MREDRDYQSDQPLEEHWVGQDALTFGGLAGVGIVMVQPFLTSSTPLDRSATITVVSFAIAIPLLAALILVNQHESFRRRRAPSVIVAGTKAIALLTAFVGLVAGFWHVHQIAGIAFLVSGIIAVGAHSAGSVRLEGRTGTTNDDSGPPVAPDRS